MAFFFLSHRYYGLDGRKVHSLVVAATSSDQHSMLADGHCSWRWVRHGKRTCAFQQAYARRWLCTVPPRANQTWSPSAFTYASSMDKRICIYCIWKYHLNRIQAFRLGSWQSGLALVDNVPRHTNSSALVERSLPVMLTPCRDEGYGSALWHSALKELWGPSPLIFFPRLRASIIYLQFFSFFFYTICKSIVILQATWYYACYCPFCIWHNGNEVNFFFSPTMCCKTSFSDDKEIGFHIIVSNWVSIFSKRWDFGHKICCKQHSCYCPFFI